MSYQGQDPNQQGQYPGSGYGGGYTPPQPQPTDPYSGQQYGQQGGQQPNYGQPPYGQQQYGTPGAAPTSMGMDQNVAAGLSYVLTWVTGLIFFLMEKQNRFVRFHAMQSILFFLPLGILIYITGVIPFFNLFLPYLLELVGFVGWIVLMVNAFQGKYFKLPIIGDYAERYVNTGSFQ